MNPTASRTAPLQRAARAALLALLALPSASCTLIIDRSPAQCESDADCAGFAGTVCSAEQVCVEPPCATHQDCTALLGPYHVCRHEAGVCADLRSTECAVVEGDYTNDDAFLFGVVVPTEGEAAQTGRSLTNAVRLALREFEQTANGLPPKPGATARRPLAFVGCNDNGDADTAVAAAQHLTSLEIPAIIGAAFSGITIKMATEATIPAQTLLISPSATSVALTDLNDGGLVWRTSPSDVFQARAMVQYVPSIEETVRTDLSLMTSDKVRLAILHKGDSYGSGLGKAIEKDLALNGAAALDPSNNGSYVRFDYGDPDNPSANPTRFEEAVQDALALAPHIIILVGTTEAVVDVLAPLEQSWQAPYRPRYVLTDGVVVTPLWEFVGTDAALRQRVTGTIPGTTNVLFQGFRSEFNTQYSDGTSPDVFGAAGAYDATYLLAYSAVVAGGEPITGPVLAEGLKRMVPPGDLVRVGTDDINSTFTTLLAGENVDFDGASGPLDFNVATGEAPSDIQIWCLQSSGGAATGAIGSGLYLDAKTDQLTGTIGAVCN